MADKCGPFCQHSSHSKKDDGAPLGKVFDEIKKSPHKGSLDIDPFSGNFEHIHNEGHRRVKDIVG